MNKHADASAGINEGGFYGACGQNTLHTCVLLSNSRTADISSPPHTHTLLLLPGHKCVCASVASRLLILEGEHEPLEEVLEACHLLLDGPRKSLLESPTRACVTTAMFHFMRITWPGNTVSGRQEDTNS